MAEILRSTIIKELKSRADDLDETRERVYPLSILRICLGQPQCFHETPEIGCGDCEFIRVDDRRSSLKILKDMKRQH